MRLHRLEITGVGPFREHQVIDFEPMTAAGLFLIDGPTGSGKTTIIDAITFALFGTTSGFESDSDRLRSDYATMDDPTEVVLDFSVRGRRHRITRSPEYERATKRKTASGVTTQAARQNLVEFAADGSPLVTLTAAADIGVHVQELLGMGSQQFRQLAVLPQGEFAHLLRMSPRERLDALQHLLGSDFFNRVQAALLRRAEQARSDLHAAQEKGEAAVRSFVNRATEVDVPVAELCATLTSVEKHETVRLQAVDQILTMVDRAATEAEQQDAVCQAAVAKVRVERDDAARAAEAVGALIEARAALEQALGLLDATGTDEVALITRRRVLTERIGTLRPLAQWEEKADERDREREELRVNAENAEALVAKLELTRDQLPEHIADATKQRNDAEAFVAGRDALQQQVEQCEARVQLYDRMTTLKSKGKELRDASAAAERKRVQAKRKLDEAEQQRDVLYQAQLAGQAAHLAAALVAGEPCPVCGGAEHPHPAKTDIEYPADREVERARSAVGAARQAFDDAVGEQQAADGDLRDHEARLAELEEGSHADPNTDPRDELDALIMQMKELEEAARTLPDLRSAVEDLVKRTADIDQELRAAERAAVQARERLQGFDERVHDRMRDIRAATNSLDSATRAVADAERELNEVEHAIDAWHRVQSAAVAVGSAVESPEIVMASARSAEQRFERANTEAEQARERSITLANAKRALAELAEQVRTALHDGATVAEAIADVVQLADIAAARSPANRRKLPLASYAVQLRFAHVLDAGSLHLERMSAGQYSFVLDDAAHGRGLAGLGINVRDAWTGQDRDPKTLSGGETFYASLALALGLADVVQAETGGAELETLFVDEGFGSLDPDTLQLVLDQLDHLRSGGRVVGVISHVTEMKERIPDRIQVIPQPDHTSIVNQVPEAADQLA